ncbi:hypothetical protein S245_020406 [Arachis hypogaea]
MQGTIPLHLALGTKFFPQLVGDDHLMSNAKRIEKAVLEYVCNALLLKDVGRSEEPNSQITNEQTTAVAMLSFIHTSIFVVMATRQKRNYELIVLLNFYITFDAISIPPVSL